METKFIGTPWTASGTGAAINGVMRAKTSSGHEYEYEVILARTMTPFFHARTLKERKDAALLIAAAPELFAALQAIVKRIEFYSAMGEHSQRPNIEQWEYTEGSTEMANARAAIAKATGEQS